ncbi:MAG: energy transducer TonB [Candidatus Obscuribacterales bacterium]|nr:energy transducer TonB [Candidatus Obscuribacterales bacterium]
MIISFTTCAAAATEKLTVESVSEGPSFTARKALLQEIIQAEKRGIGISPYSKAFAEIDALAKSGGSPEQIETRTKALHSALEHQLTTKVTAVSGGTRISASTVGTTNTASFSSSASPGTLNAYCDLICNHLQRSWKVVPGMRKDVHLKVFAGTTGSISRVELDTDQEEFGSICQQVLAQMKTLKFPEHPPRELSLNVTISPQLKDFSVGVADVDCDAYIGRVQERIKRAWFPPKRSKSVHAVALFQVNREGQVLSCELSPSSGDSEVDRAAMSAIKNASPFSGAPDGMPSRIPIRFTFDYNVHENR